MHQLLSGTLRHITAVNFAPRQYIVRHTTLCMRFSSSTQPFLMSHSTEVTAHATLFHTMSNIILGLCTHIRLTLLATSITSQLTRYPGTIHNLAPSNKNSALTDPTIEAPVGTSRGIFLYRMRFRLSTSHNPTLRWCHNTLYARILYK